MLAHEAAHIHSDHVLYQTALVILLRLSQSLPLLAGLPLVPIRYALLEWFRAAELSCDRAAALLTRDPQAVCRTLMVLSAGAAAEHLNLDAFIKQGMDYSEKGSGVERLSRLIQDLQVTHPLPVKRVRELLDWVREGDYDRIVGGEYMRVGRGAAAERGGRGRRRPLRRPGEGRVREGGDVGVRGRRRRWRIGWRSGSGTPARAPERRIEGVDGRARRPVRPPFLPSRARSGFVDGRNGCRATLTSVTPP